MLVIVPMAGCGQRFVDAGYVDPKPLIRIDDRRIIDHVAGSFDPSDRFVFICNDKDSAAEWMCAAGFKTVVTMPPHKLGPVWTVMAACDHIRDDEPVVIAYCDGAIRWDRQRFERHVRDLDGCLFTHTGFHPHTLSSTRMAFVRESDGRVREVREKASFTDCPEKEHASSGVYWFRRGRDLKKYFDRAVAENVSHNGEFYITLVYNLLIRDGLRVGYFDAPFACFGTPAEVSNYSAWSVILRGEQVKSEADALACYRFWRQFHKAS